MSMTRESKKRKASIGSLSIGKMEGDYRQHQAAKAGSLADLMRLVEEGEAEGRRQVVVNERDKKDRTPLHYAAQAGQLNVVKYLVESGADLHAEGDNKRLPIHYAAMTRPHKATGKEESGVILYLLGQGVDINSRDAVGLTPLHIAVMRGNTPAVFNLLSADKININIKDKTDMTPLHLACLHGNEDIVEMMLGMKAAMGMQGCRSSPLHAACQGGHMTIVKRLLKECQRKNILSQMLTSCDSQNWTPFHILVDGGSYDIVEVVLEFAKNVKELDLVNMEGPNLDTPLHTACAAGQLALTKLLVDRGANIESANWNNATPLLHACSNDHSEVAKFLIDRGADVSARDELGFTPLLAAADGGHIDTLRVLLVDGAEMGNTGVLELFHWTIQEQKPDVIKLLLSHRSGLRVVITDDEIAGLILPAAQNGSSGIVSELIRWKKETIHRVDDNKNTPLHWAAAGGHDLTTQALLKAKAKVQERNSLGQMPLHLAAANGWSRTVEVLLKARSPVDSVDGKGCTPLHLASINGQLKIMKLLFARQADVTIKDWDNMNCLDHAISQGHEDVAMLILNHDLWWKVLCSARSETNSTPMRELIRNMPGVAEKVLDNCVTVVESKSGRHEEIEFNYELIDDAFAEWMQKPSTHEDAPDSIRTKEQPYHKNGTLKKHAEPYTSNSNVLTQNHPLPVMVSFQREELLAHPLVSSLLNHKWVTVGRKLYALSLTIYMLFLTALTGYIIVTPPRYYVKNVTEEGTVNWYVNGEEQWTQGYGELTLFLFGEIGPWIILGLSGINILRELVQMIWQRRAYLNWVNFLEVSLYILAILMVLPISEVYYTDNIMLREAWQWQCGAVAIFLAWLNFILFTMRFSTIGIYVIMFTYILRTFLKIVVLLMLFLVAFALGFYSLLMNQNPFHNLGYCIIKVFTMLLGEFGYDEIFHGTDYLGTENTLETDGEEAFFLHAIFHPPLTAIMFTLMLAVMPILFQNLLVGLAVEDIHGIKKKAKLHQLSMQVDLAMEVQRALPLFIWRSAIVSKKRLCAKRRRFQGLAGIFRRLNGEDDFLAKAMPIAKRPGKDQTIDTSLATADNMNDLRYRLRLLEQSIMELKRGGSNRFSQPRSVATRSVANRRTVISRPSFRNWPTPGGGGSAAQADNHDNAVISGEHGAGLNNNISTMERRQTKLKGQLDKMERMLMTLVPQDQRDGGFDSSDEDSD